MCEGTTGTAKEVCQAWSKELGMSVKADAVVRRVLGTVVRVGFVEGQR